MTLPASLTRRSWQWNLAVSLLVVGDLSAMLAAFMPMKAILVLASDSVPGFFPSFLVDSAPVVAALALIALGALFAAVSWGSKRSIAGLDEETRGKAATEPTLISWKHEDIATATNERKVTASTALIIPAVVVLVLVSVPYLLLSMLWLASSALWQVVRVRRSARKASYQSGVDQFSHQLADWLRATSLWSVVVLALITLLLAPPALGSTAILIAAIFGRRLNLAVAEIVPEIISKGVVHAHHRVPSRTANFVNNLPTGSVVRRPIEFLSSAVGRNELENELHRRGLDSENFRILNPRAQSLSLVAQHSSGDQTLIRLFNPDAQRERDRELQLRQSHLAGLFPRSNCVQNGKFTGFPAIFVSLDSGESRVDFESIVSDESVARFQIQREMESTLERPGALVVRKISRDRFTDQLVRLSRIPGDHVQQCLDLARRVSDLDQLLSGLPTAIVPSSPLNAHYFYGSEDGQICFLGGVSWSWGHMGDSWGNLVRFEKQYRGIVESSIVYTNVPFSVVLLNAELNQLESALRVFQLSQITSLLDRALLRIDDITGQQAD